jgi:hypothetical protein
MPCWRLIFRVIATNVRRFKYEVTGRLQSPQAPPLRQRYAERRGFAPRIQPHLRRPRRRVIERDGLPFNAQPQRDAVRQGIFLPTFLPRGGNAAPTAAAERHAITHPFALGPLGEGIQPMVQPLPCRANAFSSAGKLSITRPLVTPAAAIPA